VAICSTAARRRNNVIGVRGVSSPTARNAAQQFIERVKLRAEFVVQLRYADSTEQFADGEVMALAECAADFQRLIAFAASGGAAMASS